MLNNSFGVLLYLVLPYHWSWKLLSSEERERLYRATVAHNQDQYANPEDYDAEHRRIQPPHATKEGQLIVAALNSYCPSSILEIGPGNGYYTRLFLDNTTVATYTAIDIVQPFLDHIWNKMIKPGERDRVTLLCGEVSQQKFSRKFDAIFFNSSLHHMPAREAIFKRCESLLTEKGVIILIEPRHSIFRVMHLIKKYIKTYRKRAFWSNKNNIGTHHMLTVSELRHLARKSNLVIKELHFFSIKGEKYFKKKPAGFNFFFCRSQDPLSLFAYQMYVVFERKNA